MNTFRTLRVANEVKSWLIEPVIKLCSDFTLIHFVIKRGFHSLLGIFTTNLMD